MSRLYVATVATSVTAATSKIPIEFAPAATADTQLVALDCTFDTVFATTYPLVEFCTYGTVGSGGTTPTPVKYGENQDTAALTVIRINDSTPPTTITPLWSWYWSAGYLWPLGREFQMVHSGKFCIRVTSPSTGNVVINAVFAE